VAVFPIRRREFLAALASLGVPASSGSDSSRYPARSRKPSPYESVLAHVDAGTDEFPFEKEAQDIENRLSAMLSGQALELPGDFTGASPMPRRYNSAGEGVAEAEFGADGDFQTGLSQWISSLGRILRARFFVLPGHIVRYEIASDGAYPVRSRRRW
jgi:hypothetical protein